MVDMPTSLPKYRRGCPPGQGTVASQPKGGRTGYIGMPQHQRSDEIARKVRENARTLIPVRYVAAAAGVALRTMYRHYREELDQGRAETLTVIAAQEVKQAMSGPSMEIKGDPDSRRFVISRMLGMLNQERPPEIGPEGPSDEEIDLSRLTAEEFAIYGRITAKLHGLDPDSIEFEIIDD